MRVGSPGGGEERSGAAYRPRRRSCSSALRGSGSHGSTKGSTAAPRPGRGLPAGRAQPSGARTAPASLPRRTPLPGVSAAAAGTWGRRTERRGAIPASPLAPGACLVLRRQGPVPELGGGAQGLRRAGALAPPQAEDPVLILKCIEIPSYSVV